MDAAVRTPGRLASRVVAAASVAYVLLVLAVTLLPAPWPSDVTESPGGVLNLANWFAEETWSRGFNRDFMLNVLMFVPIGIIAGRYVRPWWLRILAPIALTFAIEVIQLPLPDRISDPRDIVANTLGAIVGILAMWIVTAYRRDRSARESVSF